MSMKGKMLMTKQASFKLVNARNLTLLSYYIGLKKRNNEKFLSSRKCEKKYSLF